MIFIIYRKRDTGEINHIYKSDEKSEELMGLAEEFNKKPENKFVAELAEYEENSAFVYMYNYQMDAKRDFRGELERLAHEVYEMCDALRCVDRKIGEWEREDNGNGMF